MSFAITFVVIRSNTVQWNRADRSIFLVANLPNIHDVGPTSMLQAIEQNHRVGTISSPNDDDDDDYYVDNDIGSHSDAPNWKNVRYVCTTYVCTAYGYTRLFHGPSRNSNCLVSHGPDDDDDDVRRWWFVLPLALKDRCLVNELLRDVCYRLPWQSMKWWCWNKVEFPLGCPYGLWSGFLR